MQCVLWSTQNDENKMMNCAQTNEILTSGRELRLRKVQESLSEHDLQSQALVSTQHLIDATQHPNVLTQPVCPVI